MKTTSPLIKRQTVTSSVTDLIRRRIISGQYRGGHQIRQEAIADELGVSRIPVREALVQLEGEGLVVIHTHRGAIVSTLTILDAIDIFDSRSLLEPFMLKKAMENAQEADIARVNDAFNAFETELEHGATPARLSELNWLFHTALSLPAGRPRSLAVLQSLYISADRYLRLQIDENAARTKALADHKGLAEAFSQGDCSLAVKLLGKHIDDARDDVIRGLNIRSDTAIAPDSGQD